MTPVRILCAAALLGGLAAPAAAGPAAVRGDLLQEVLRQQSRAERALCASVRSALEAGTPADSVVRTAVELGHAPCEAVRCALEAGAPLAPALRGAAEAGAPVEVLSRCAVESGAEPAAVAAALNAILLEPSLCYFLPALDGGAPVVPPYGDRDRHYRLPELSPFLP